MSCIYSLRDSSCYLYEKGTSLDTDPVGWDCEGFCVVEDDEDLGYSCQHYEPIEKDEDYG